LRIAGIHDQRILTLGGEDMSEMLDLVAAQLKVLQIARLKKSCRR